MTLTQRTIDGVRLAAWALAVAACAGVADAQTPPYALTQYSTLTGSGDSITATWVPVVTAKGTVFKNVSLLFNVDASGNLTIAPGYPQVVASPAPVVSSFKAGKYKGPSTVLSGLAGFTVAGPGLTNGGATEWSLAASAGAAYCTSPATATWYVGPIATSPLAARLKAAGITSTAWSYGVGTGLCSGLWYTNALLGFSQVGNTLTIVSFTNGGDKPEPVDSLTYTLVP